MEKRPPQVAGMFYPSSAAECAAEIDQAVSASPGPALEPGREPVGGIVPHAGWSYSGPTAARVYRALAGGFGFETFLVFGAVHSWGVNRPSVCDGGSWITPLGEIRVDADLAREIVDASGGLVAADSSAHDGEHSIEVQVPFIQRLFPEAMLCPVAVPPSEDAIRAGTAAAEAIGKLRRRAAVLGSTDLTHYGRRFGFSPRGSGEQAHEWAKDVNDRRFLDAAAALDGKAMLAAAAADHSACGAGAAAAAASCAAALGARSAGLLQHTTSHEVMRGRRAGDFVGYAALLFMKG